MKRGKEGLIDEKKKMISGDNTPAIVNKKDGSGVASIINNESSNLTPVIINSGRGKS